jgi:hypothetical protein
LCGDEILRFGNVFGEAESGSRTWRLYGVNGVERRKEHWRWSGVMRYDYEWMGRSGCI